MRAPLQISALFDDLVAKAFPLIQAMWPEVGLEAWQRFVAFYNDHMLTGKAGVFGVHDTAGYICGLVAYRLDRDLRHGPVLAVDLFTAADLTNSVRLVQTMLDEIARRAEELDCAGIQIHLQRDQAGLAARLRAGGLSAESTHYWLRLAPRQNAD